MNDEPISNDEAAPPAVEGDPLAACTAVLMTVPYEVARRLEGFLNANGVLCRLRKSDVTPESLAEEAMRSGSSEAYEALRGPFGRVIKAKLKRDLSAEIKVTSTGLLSTYDVLVRPEDLPSELAGLGASASTGPPGAPAGSGADPWDRSSATSSPAGSAASVRGEGSAGGPVTITELPWNSAWDLVARLAAVGIPAAVLETDASTAHLPMERRIVPVGVRPEDVERARAMIET